MKKMFRKVLYALMIAALLLNITACTASVDKDESNILFISTVVRISGSVLGLDTSPAAVNSSESMPILLFDSVQKLKDSSELLEQEFDFYEDVFEKYDDDYFKDKTLILAGFITGCYNPDEINVRDVRKDGEKLSFTIEVVYYATTTKEAAQGCGYVFIELNKDDIKDCTEFDDTVYDKDIEYGHGL